MREKLAGCPSVEHIQVITQLFPDIQSPDSRAEPIPGAKPAGTNRSKFSQETRNRDSDQPSCLLSSLSSTEGAPEVLEPEFVWTPVWIIHQYSELCTTVPPYACLKGPPFLLDERTWFLCLGLGLPTIWQIDLGVGMPCRQVCAGL